MNLKIKIVFVACLFWVAGFASCAQQPKEKFIGLQLWSVKDDIKKDVPATLAAVGKIGYKYVETAGYEDGRIYGLEPTKFKQLCEENGLQFLGAHTGQGLPTPETWNKTMAWWDICIEAHKKAGVKWIVQPWMGEEGYNSLVGLKEYCKYFNAVGEKCNTAGIRFGYHNHAKEYTTLFDGETVYDWMLELTDPEKVMFELDLYWIVEGGKDPLDYFEKYPGRFELFHIKDDKEVGASGKMDFEAMFARREKAGAQYGIVEVEHYSFEPLESVKHSFEFLKSAKYIDLYTRQL